MSEHRPTQRVRRPFLPAFRGASPASAGRDLLAGLTLAAIAIPEQMATARLGGFPAEVGFFAFCAACVGFALFGANRQMSVGADSTITPIFAGGLVLVAAAGSPQYAANAAILAVMVGVLLVAAGVFKLGWIADLLSKPVITGFLAGVAVHIAVSQAPSVLGLPEGSGSVAQRVAAIWSHIGAINAPSIGIGLGVLAVTIAAEKLSGRIPGALIALAAATAATAGLHLEHHGVALLGHVSGGLPSPRLPIASLETIRSLLGLSLLVTLVIMLQTAATTRSFSAGEADPDVARDYVGVGVASLLAGVFGAFPVNASPPRTAIVAQSGGQTQFAGLFAAAAVILLALFGSRALAYVPTAALGGILLFVAQRILHVDDLIRIMRRSPTEFGLALCTIGLIVALPIQTGVAISVFLSLVHGVFTTTRARPIAFERVPGTTVWWPAPSVEAGETEPGVLVIGFQAPLSFLNAYDFRRGVADAIAAAKGEVTLVVFEASSIVEIDFTAAEILAEVIKSVRDAGMDFAIARLESVRAANAIRRLGVIDQIGPDHVFRSVEEAVRALAHEPADGARSSGSSPASVAN